MKVKIEFNGTGDLTAGKLKTFRDFVSENFGVLVTIQVPDPADPKKLIDKEVLSDKNYYLSIRKVESKTVECVTDVVQ